MDISWSIINLTNKEMEKMKNVNKYMAEYENLKDSGDFFKLDEDVEYTVEFLDEGGELYNHYWDGREYKRKDFTVKVSGGQYNDNTLTWSINHSGKSGLYGMLYYIFGKIGHVVGYLLHIKASGSNEKRRYTVLEYDKIIENEKNNTSINNIDVINNIG